ncbi:hypothetical protein [Methylobacterium komagatae]
MVGYRCEIVNTATGEARTYESDRFDESTPFWWRDGNYACDCNRKTTWLRLADEYPEDCTDEEDEALCPCGHGSFRVAELVLMDGRRIPIDRPV